MVYFYAGYLLFMNLLAFFLMLADKKLARAHKWRIPERTLLTAALFGGGIGGFLAMRIFRHKTRKLKFTLLLPLFIALWAAISYFVFF